MPIKFVDLAAQNREVRARIDEACERIHEKTSYVAGPQVAEFERAFANYLGVSNAVGVGSGTDALRLALLALGVGPGDEVITVPMTFIATTEAILQTGARPVFVDIDANSGTMSTDALNAYLQKGNFTAPNGPRAIVPVHLYGLPARMEQISEVAQRFGIPVVEDACQAHGARAYIGGEWKMAGAMSSVGCFSFYPGKNLGAWGEAGAVATNDPEIARRVALLRDHGRLSHYLHQESGYNARMDTLQAAVLLPKLERLDEWNSRRRASARRYCELLAGCGASTPIESEGAESCYHLFVIRSEHRDRVFEQLSKAEIGCGIHYPVPLHLQPACRDLGYRSGDFPESERLADTVLSLPMHPHLEERELRTVAKAVRTALAA
ncbi:MAG TPA: DegT/DnrJ/EryC1/StrS family aminotransferase [Candidatus Binataceae bacterium]|nr:DegT/DnrJ/EryC1/StrS family aminotransferase [Candidatus Binataceae bacterium]